jgi:hypothetical protein
MVMPQIHQNVQRIHITAPALNKKRTDTIYPYHCYPGIYAPRTLDIQLDHAETGVIGLATELLALTKMNWNSTELVNLEPITLSGARSVGRILRYIPPHRATHSRYSFFM